MSERICALEGCNNVVVQKPLGVPKKYCCNLCAQRAWRKAHPWPERNETPPKQCQWPGCTETFKAMGSRRYCDKHRVENKRMPSDRRKTMADLGFARKNSWNSSDLMRLPAEKLAPRVNEIIREKIDYVG